MKLSVTCEKCNFWFPRLSPDKEVRYGECRFNPPNVVIYTAEQLDSNNDLSGSYFPTTKINDWCGRFIKEEG